VPTVGGARFMAPGLSVAGHGICGDEDFTHKRGRAGPAVLPDQAFVEAVERRGRIAARAALNRAPAPGPAKANRLVRAGLAAGAACRAQADRRGDLFAGQQPEFRQVGDQNASDDRPTPKIVRSSSEKSTSCRSTVIAAAIAASIASEPG
jgi:hypothetical protein